MRAQPLSVRLAVALYAFCLPSLPAGFRRAYGREMRADIEERCVTRLGDGGVIAVGTTLVASLLDLGVWSARERRRQLAEFLGIGAPQGRWGGVGRTGRSLELGERMRSVLKALELATRSLLRRPGFTAVAIVTIGVGLGSVVAIFTVVNAVLLQPLPYAESDRMVTVRHHAPGLELPELENSPGTLAWYHESADFLSHLAGITTAQRVLTGWDEPTRIELLSATDHFFDVMGTTPEIGRPLTAADNEEGANPVAVITHEFWTNQLGADPDVLSTRLELDGVSTEIVGVLPEKFVFVEPGPVGIVPYGPIDPLDFGTFGINGVGRLAPDVSLEAASARLAAMQSRAPEVFPDLTPEFLESAGWSASLTPLKERVVGEAVTTLWLVLGTVGFVLVIAWANVANLFLVRAEGRQKEIAVRVALGAGRRRVAASFLSEALVVGLVGGVVGLIVSQIGVDALLRLASDSLPRSPEVQITPLVLAFTAALAVVTGVLLGLLPMTRFTASAATATLRDGTRGSTVGRGRTRVRGVLVAGQLAMAMVLVVGSGLMFKSLAALRQVDLGFEPAGVVSVEASIGDGTSLVEAANFYQAVVERARALPGVEAAAVVTQAPFMSGTMNGGSFVVRGHPRDEGALPPVGYYRGASPDYFDVLGVSLVAGRPMTQADLDGTTRSAWIDESFAKAHFPEETYPGGPIGQAISWDGQLREEGEDAVPWVEIVGVVSDTKYRSIREDEAHNAYFPLRIGDLGYPSLATATLLVRSREGADPTAPVPALRSIVSEVNGSVPVTRIQTMEEAIAEAIAGDSVTFIILGIAAGMALFLGAVGLFGVVSYVVSQRTREIGVRMALGARQEQVSRMVIYEGLGLAGAGIALGLVGALGLSKVLGSVLYESVSATDPATFALAPVVLLGVSVLATWLPARRAARVDPMQSLREE